jgi:hypothetical protein
MLLLWVHYAVEETSKPTFKPSDIWRECFNLRKRVDRGRFLSSNMGEREGMETIGASDSLAMLGKSVHFEKVVETDRQQNLGEKNYHIKTCGSLY